MTGEAPPAVLAGDLDDDEKDRDDDVDDDRGLKAFLAS
jgi:hypothetical protein